MFYQLWIKLWRHFWTSPEVNFFALQIQVESNFKSFYFPSECIHPLLFQFQFERNVKFFENFRESFCTSNGLKSGKFCKACSLKLCVYTGWVFHSFFGVEISEISSMISILIYSKSDFLRYRLAQHCACVTIKQVRL